MYSPIIKNKETITAKPERIVTSSPKNSSLNTLFKIIPTTNKIINDQNNFDVTATFTINEVLITGLDGTAQEYYVYVNNASTVTNFNMKFNIN